MNKYFFYAYGGSANHGCEAIARSTIDILGCRPKIYSPNLEHDKKYGLSELADVKEINNIRPKSLRHIAYYIKKNLSKSYDHYSRYIYSDMLSSSPGIALSIGGDNYCYSSSDFLGSVNKQLCETGFNTVLWGCSIEPELLKNPSLVKDMKRYSVITPRESITYQALVDAGVYDNVFLHADPAFALETQHLPLPENFAVDNTVGINVSPLIRKYSTGASEVVENYTHLIECILKDTDMNIAFIPHVVISGNDDLEILSNFYRKYEKTNRVCLVEDCNCTQLKGYISRCRFFVGARTHATIAAYSSCIPTLVSGYSVKARGIARDLFGSEEHYVLPVQNMNNIRDLAECFFWIVDNEQKIKDHLVAKIPVHIESAKSAVKSLQRAINL